MKELTESELVEKVKRVIKPQFPVWVLFANGTFVIVDGDDLASPPGLRNRALEEIWSGSCRKPRR